MILIQRTSIDLYIFPFRFPLPAKFSVHALLCFVLFKFVFISFSFDLGNWNDSATSASLEMHQDNCL